MSYYKKAIAPGEFEEHEDTLIDLERNMGRPDSTLNPTQVTDKLRSALKGSKVNVKIDNSPEITLDVTGIIEIAHLNAFTIKLESGRLRIPIEDGNINLHIQDYTNELFIAIEQESFTYYLTIDMEHSGELY